MTNTLDELLAMPTLDLGPLPTLDDLGLQWTAPPIDSAPNLAIPNADKITLEVRALPAGRASGVPSG